MASLTHPDRSVRAPAGGGRGGTKPPAGGDQRISTCGICRYGVYQRDGKTWGNGIGAPAGWNHGGASSRTAVTPMPDTLALPPTEAANIGARMVAMVRVDPATGCHLWTGAVDRNGYGLINLSRPKRLRRAHRVAYALTHGGVPAGADVEHVCHTRDDTCAGPDCRHRRCVNPDHLEAVTHRENVLRDRSFSAREARQTHCRRGNHPLSGENLYQTTAGSRQCRACKRASNAAARRHGRSVNRA